MEKMNKKKRVLVLEEYKSWLYHCCLTAAKLNSDSVDAWFINPQYTKLYTDERVLVHALLSLITMQLCIKVLLQFLRYFMQSILLNRFTYFYDFWNFIDIKYNITSDEFWSVC